MKQISIMWDLDGTLIDSYKIIASSIEIVIKNKNITYSYEEVREEVTKRSCGEFLTDISNKYGLNLVDLDKEVHSYINSRYLEVEPIKNAKKTLDILSEMGVKNYIYTHKGNTTHDILKNIDMYKYFSEILTIEDGFKRKPDPEATNYLINKYNMDLNHTYYIGDRKLDIESANNAHIKSVLFLPPGTYVKPTGKEDYIIYDLLEVIDLI